MDLNKILEKLELLKNDQYFLILLESVTYMDKLNQLIENMLPSYYGKNQTFNNKVREFGYDVIDKYDSETEPFYQKLYDYFIQKMDFDELGDNEHDILFEFYSSHKDLNRLFEELQQYYVECSKIPEGYVQLTLPDGKKQLVPEEEFDALFE
jgi:uncharacterized membrane-anchored protein YjiN (DUF445 family)